MGIPVLAFTFGVLVKHPSRGEAKQAGRRQRQEREKACGPKTAGEGVPGDPQTVRKCMDRPGPPGERR